MTTTTFCEGYTKCILYTGTLQVVTDDGDEREICLAAMSIPKVPRRDQQDTEKFAWEAYEFLRILVVGRRVNCQLINENNGKHFCEIRLCDGPYATYSVNEAMVREGLAKVHKGANKKEGQFFARMVAAEKDASDGERNLHSSDSECEQSAVITGWTNGQPELLTEFMDQNKGCFVSAVVDGVISPTLYRLMIISKDPTKPHMSVQCSLAGVTSNSQQYPDLALVLEESKRWVECNLLQRDVRFMPLTVNNSNGHLMGILQMSKTKSANYELAKKGWVHVLENSLRDEKSLFHLTEAQEKAKERQSGVYSSYTATSQDPISTFDASLIEVVNGECIIVSEHAPGTPVELGIIHRIYLASVRAPRHGSLKRDAEPFAEEARERLHQLLQDQRLRIDVEFTKVTPEGLLKTSQGGPGSVTEEMNCGSVFIHRTQNAAIDLLSKGLVTVPYVSGNAENSTEKGFHHNAYLKAENDAKTRNAGRHKVDVIPSAVARIMDLTGKDSSHTKSKSCEYLLSGNKKLEGVVVNVYSPGRFRVRFNSEKIIANVTLSNLSVSQGARPAMRGMPERKSDPLNEEALLYARSRLLQRTVRVEVSMSDKGGNFLSQVYLKNENFGNTLLSVGYATISRDFRATENQKSLQAQAFASGVGMWSNTEFMEAFKAAQEPEIVEVAASPATVTPPQIHPSVSVVHVNSVHDFFVAEESTEAAMRLERLQARVQVLAKDCGDDFHPKINTLCLAIFPDDNQWYRAQVVRLDRKSRTARVLFIDFGNSNEVGFSLLKPLPKEVDASSIGAFAKRYRLAGLTDKNEFSDEAATQFFHLTTSPPYRMDAYHPSTATNRTSSLPLVVIQNSDKVSINSQLLEIGCVVLSRSRTPINLPEHEIKAMKNASHDAESSNRGVYRFVAGHILSDEEEEQN
eukprot:GHVH01012045.1.p1 GENE.GHVH01012045.1~~GHVH01012045.1.p1  ORF type:complete len:915 (+),score=116.05 GHVH01012045.1:155-2899(+)